MSVLGAFGPVSSLSRSASSFASCRYRYSESSGACVYARMRSWRVAVATNLCCSSACTTSVDWNVTKQNERSLLTGDTDTTSPYCENRILNSSSVKSPMFPASNHKACITAHNEVGTNKHLVLGNRYVLIFVIRACII